MEGSSCCNKYFWFEVLILFVSLYFLINYIVDHWISTKVKQNVLVTGCDSGFGLQTALVLSESNCKVFAGCLTQDGVKQLENDARFQGMAFIMDVTKDEDVQNTKKIIEENGGIDGLVNNAGILIHGLIEWQSIELMKKTFEVNYWGLVRVTKVILPLLKKSRGRIVNLTSIGGRLTPPYTAPYYCSKYAAEAFSDSLRLEVKPWGISVHIIEPSYYKTAITNEETVRRNWQKLWNEQPDEIQNEIDEKTFHEFVTAFYKQISIGSENIIEVALVIKHALLAKFPRRRYITGVNCGLAAFATHLPTVLGDFFMALSVPLLRPIKTPKKTN
eukprot:TCONS_00053610-protein